MQYLLSIWVVWHVSNVKWILLSERKWIVKSSGTRYEYANAAFQSHLFEGRGPIPQSAKKPTESSVKHLLH